MPIAVQPVHKQSDDLYNDRGFASNEERVALTPADDIKKERKTRFAYKEADDVKLLQEILSDDGLFIDGTKDVLQWHGIHKSLQSGGMDVSEHGLKRRLKTIYDTFCVAERTSQRASGVEEPLDEKTQLLQEYHELLCERQTNEAGGRAISDAALNTFDRSSSLENEKDPLKFDVNQYLRETLRTRTMEHEEETEWKRRRVKLDNRLISMQENMIEMQKEATRMQHETMKIMAALIEKVQK
ncbi:unnamed protein product [Aphanomyces euteiches]